MPAAGPFLWSLLSARDVGAGSVLVRLLKKPNLADLLGLGAGAGAGMVLDLRFSLSFGTSGVVPRTGPRSAGDALGAGPGEGILDGAFIWTAGRGLVVGATPCLDSVEPVRLCDEGKDIMLLWIIGEGPRRPMISGVPSRLGRDGRRVVCAETGD